MTNDDMLYRRYLAGDDSGLTALVENYGDNLVFYINGYLRDVDEAEDLMIEAFAYLIAKKPRIHDGAFRAYLYKTARNLALRCLERNRLRQCFSLDNLEWEPESNALVEQLIQTEERSRSLHLCMEQLHPDYREALYLVYFENMTHAEAAVIMGKSKKQTSDLVFRARHSLRKRLEQEDFTDAEY